MNPPVGAARTCRGLSLTLGERRAHLRRFSLPLGKFGAHLRCLGLLGTLAKGVARDPGNDEPERNEYELACCLGAWDVGDDDHDASEHDRKADSGLPLVAQVSEQERDCQPDDPEAAVERDQQPVDVREPMAMSQ
jgi:hypothetical protein